MLALLPLDTLPGWPHADNPSVLAMLALMIVLPLAVAAVVMVLGMGGRWRRSRPEEPYAPDTVLAMEYAQRQRAQAGLPASSSAGATAVGHGGEHSTDATPRRGLPLTSG